MKINIEDIFEKMPYKDWFIPNANPLQLDGLHSSTDNDKAILFVDVPGCKSEDVEIIFEKNTMLVFATRKVLGSNIKQDRKLKAHMPIDGTYYNIDESTATLEDGVVTITIPKIQNKQEESKPKTIKVSYK